MKIFGGGGADEVSAATTKNFHLIPIPIKL